MLLYGQFMLDTSESAFPTSIPILSVAVSATRKREHSCGTLQCNDNHSSLQLPVTAVTIPLMCQVTLHDGCYLVSLLTVHRIGTLCYFLCSKPGGCFIVQYCTQLNALGGGGVRQGTADLFGNISDPDKFISNF